MHGSDWIAIAIGLGVRVVLLCQTYAEEPVTRLVSVGAMTPTVCA